MKHRFVNQNSLCAWIACSAAMAGAKLVVAGELENPEPQGFYVLQSGRGDDRVPDEVLSSPNLEGVVLRRRWRDVNPSRDKYDWRYLDREIGRVKEHGKKVQLLVFTGTDAPDWLYAAGARPLKFFDPRKGFGWFTMPVPWDEVMLDRYGAFIKALGDRYDAEASVTLVHAGGPTRLSLEFHLPREVSELADWSPEKLKGAWERSIRATAAAFPHKNIALNVSQVLRASDGLAPAIAERGEVVLGKRLTLQHDALAAKTSDRFATHSLVANYARRGGRIGFEMLSASHEARFGGDFGKAVEVGKAAGARYLNIYPADVSLLTGPYQAY